MPVMDKRDFLSCNLPHCAQNKHQLHHHCQLEQQERTGRNKYVLVTLCICSTSSQYKLGVGCRHLVKLLVKEGEKAVTALLDPTDQSLHDSNTVQDEVPMPEYCPVQANTRTV